MGLALSNTSAAVQTQVKSSELFLFDTGRFQRANNQELLLAEIQQVVNNGTHSAEWCRVSVSFVENNVSYSKAAYLFHHMTYDALWVPACTPSEQTAVLGWHFPLAPLPPPNPGSRPMRVWELLLMPGQIPSVVCLPVLRYEEPTGDNDITSGNTLSSHRFREPCERIATYNNAIDVQLCGRCPVVGGRFTLVHLREQPCGRSAAADRLLLLCAAGDADVVPVMFRQCFAVSLA